MHKKEKKIPWWIKDVFSFSWFSSDVTIWSLIGGVKCLVFGWLISSLYFILPKYSPSKGTYHPDACAAVVVVLLKYKCRTMQSGTHLRTEKKKRLLPRRGCYWSHGVYCPADPPPNSRCSPPSPSHYPQSPAGCLLPHLLKMKRDKSVCQCFGTHR